MGQGENYVIFLHGWGGNRRSLISIASKLSKKYCCIMVDLYGFGDSPRPPVPIKLQDYADGVMEIVRHYRIAALTLVGHSFGGRVAIKLCAEYNVTDNLILIDSAGIVPKRGISYYLSVIRYKLSRKLKLNLSKYGSEDYKKLDAVMKQTFISVVNEDLLPSLCKINVRTLIIWGEKDNATPLYMAQIMNKRIPGSKLIVIKNGGHYSYLDDKIRVNSEIVDFLEQETPC